MTTTKSTLREQLEPLADDLEKARQVIGKAAKIIAAATNENDAAFDISALYLSDEPKYYLRFRNLEVSDSTHTEKLSEIITAAENYHFNPEAQKQSKIAKLEAELAALKSS